MSRVEEYLGFDICRRKILEDKKALESMKDGLMVEERFYRYSVDDFCVIRVKVVLKAGSNDCVWKLKKDTGI